MNLEAHSQLANFIWSSCNLLRGPYKRNEYRKVILPLTVLRRFDCLLAPTKERVLKEHAQIKAKPESVVRSLLEKITGRQFYNLSKLDLPKLLDAPNQLAANLNSYTFYMQSKEFQTAVELSWSYGTQQNIGMGVIQNLLLPLPDLAEQDLIADFIDLEKGKIDKLIIKVEAAIDRLQEYRAALITAAVTGKIDVRQEAGGCSRTNTDTRTYTDRHGPARTDKGRHELARTG